jgi:iron complex outermembrane recepter protein
LKRERRWALQKVASGIFAAVLCVAGAYAEGLSAPFPSQPLADALDAFAKATGYQLVYRSELAVGMMSRGADAGLTAEQTLRQLLRDTGLAFQFINERTVVIYRSSDSSKQPNPPSGPTSAQPPPAGTGGEKSTGHRGVLGRIASLFAVCHPTSGPGAGNPCSESAETSQEGSAEVVPEVVVTGTRQAGLTAMNSPVPIDVLSSEMLQRASAKGDLPSTLAQVLPSLTTQAYGADMANLALQAKMRGLSPNHVLVLIDGKRRHTTANLEVDAGSVYQGGAGVDLNLIPLDAIDHVEVLTEGAAAQYGTDAIAGVMNVILKKNASGAQLSGIYGSNFDSAGITGDISGNIGLRPMNGAYFNLTVEMRNHGHTNRGAVDERLINPANLAAYPNSNIPDVPGYPYINKIEGDAETRLKLLFANTGFDLGNKAEFYALATYGDKHGAGYENYRLPNKLHYTDPRTAVTTYPYPFGFDPQESMHERDYSLTGGFKGKAAGWNWDVSTVYGSDHVNLYTLASANAGLYNDSGNATPSDYYDGFVATSQWTTTLDVNRDFNFEPSGRLNLAFGTEYRRETYAIGSGIPESYLDGGAQAYPGFAPTDAGIHSRKNHAGYVDFAATVADRLRIDFAGRFERYSDFGNASVGKLAYRWDFNPEFAVRGTVCNGFRAPTLAEEFYSSTTVTPVTAFVQLPPNSAGGRLLGLGTGLQPEKSVNYSVGFVLRPLPLMSMTLDLYQISVGNRIVGSGQMIGSNHGVVISPAVNAAITANGNQLDPDVLALGESGVNIFTNGISTRTRGGDFTFTFPVDHRFGHVTYSIGATYNQTSITDVRSTPAELGSVPLFDSTAFSDLTTASPRYVVNLGMVWTAGNASVNFLEKIYGPAAEFENDDSDNPSGRIQYFRTDIPVTPITNLDFSYQFRQHLRFTVGATNLFNHYPPTLNHTLLAHYNDFVYGDNQGVQQYPAFSPFGINGGFYYAKFLYTP